MISCECSSYAKYSSCCKYGCKTFFHCNYPLGYNLCKTVKQVVNFQFNVEKIYLSVLKLLPYLILIVTEF